MKTVSIIVALQAASIVLGAFAGLLAIKDVSAWGWFLFGAVICSGGTYSSKSKRSKLNKDHFRTTFRQWVESIQADILLAGVTDDELERFRVMLKGEGDE